jgi:decaprenylphospho-beta-D-ribofuranose 2-oxidase
VLDATALDGIDTGGERGFVRAGAGTTLARLLGRLLEHGQTLPVIPGTRHATVGGAIAADVHGKNHPRDGSFVSHVQSFLLCTPAGETLTVTRESDPELFAATAGGMGLTGIVLEATLRTEPLRCAWAVADVDRTQDIEQTLALMAEESEHRHAIAWLDLLAHGRHFGRGVLTRSTPAPFARAAPAPAERPRIGVPAGFPGGLLRPASVRAFNLLHWRATPRRARGRVLGMQANLFPLDALGAWNRLYGRDGLIQYQFAVPKGEERTLMWVLERLRARGMPMYLATLKRFGGAGEGLLSFPIEGWTVAVDLPAGAPGLRVALDELDELVAQAGGRVYLAKDARLRPAALAAMYPRLQRMRAVRERVDPRGALRSDMARRLGLCEAR